MEMIGAMIYSTLVVVLGMMEKDKPKGKDRKTIEYFSKSHNKKRYFVKFIDPVEGEETAGQKTVTIEKPVFSYNREDATVLSEDLAGKVVSLLELYGYKELTIVQSGPDLKVV